MERPRRSGSPPSENPLRSRLTERVGVGGETLPRLLGLSLKRRGRRSDPRLGFGAGRRQDIGTLGHRGSPHLVHLLVDFCARH